MIKKITKEIISSIGPIINFSEKKLNEACSVAVPLALPFQKFLLIFDRNNLSKISMRIAEIFAIRLS
jgi:hypothetical protein